MFLLTFIFETSVQNHSLLKECRNQISALHASGVAHLRCLGLVLAGFQSFLEAPEGLHQRTDGTPVARLAVLPLLQEVLASGEVGTLVENPPTVKDLAGVDLSQAKLLQE